ncbi:hypothetical protein HPB50_017130 [Hyalomma asiaticum]|uniref:Uncharacterized protein n=1 Tax=Hyalomma asiaticum TaxID=266040 RepID=A0ACB7TCS0_HYAAI|nr:hypothetical protein HPB50_017130 [Hyalomma asiaticum]
MPGSDRAATAAASGRGNALRHVPKDYRVVLPTLPSGEAMKSAVVLHCDISGRPYRIEHFRDPLKELGVIQEVLECRAFGHKKVDFTKSYARAVGRSTEEDRDELLMDEDEVQNAALSSETPVVYLQKSGDAGKEEEVETTTSSISGRNATDACKPDTDDVKEQKFKGWRLIGNAPKRSHDKQLGTLEERPCACSSRSGERLDARRSAL